MLQYDHRWVSYLSQVCVCVLQYDHRWVSYLSQRLIDRISSSVTHVIRNGDPVNGYPGFSLYVADPVRACKNRPVSFPGRMSYRATKPGSVCHKWVLAKAFLSVSIMLLTGDSYYVVLFLCVVSLGCSC